MILVSACLAGIDCAYDGKHRLNSKIKEMVDKKEAIPVCPEVLGGRTVPRTKAEIKAGAIEVIDENGIDVTHEFLKGAEKTLEIAKKYNIKEAVLKSKSPSCGVGKVYDGSFKGKLINGDGITVALLKRNRIVCRGI